VERRSGILQILVPLDFPKIVGVVRQGDWEGVVVKEVEKGNMVILLQGKGPNGFTDQIIVPKESNVQG